MIFAQISNQQIQNTIILNDESILSLFQNDASGNPYDFVIRVDTMYPQPGIGWGFDGIVFSSPAGSDSVEEFPDGSISLLFSKNTPFMSAGTYLNSGNVSSSNCGQSVLGHTNIIGISATNTNIVTVNPIVFQLQQRTGLNDFADIPDAVISIPIGSYSSVVNFTDSIVVEEDSEISVYMKSGDIPANPLVQVHLS